MLLPMDTPTAIFSAILSLIWLAFTACLLLYPHNISIFLYYATLVLATCCSAMILAVSLVVGIDWSTNGAIRWVDQTAATNDLRVHIVEGVVLGVFCIALWGVLLWIGFQEALSVGMRFERPVLGNVTLA
jgi:hypothetical protein